MVARLLMRMSLAATLVGCDQVTVDYANRPCGSGGKCIAGYICNPISNICDRITERCDQDTDGDSTADCIDGCIDVDGDGFGLPGGSGNTCTAADCSDSAPTCHSDCTSDLDNDSVIDCLDVCVDIDGDGYGIHGGVGTCTGADCNEAAATCTTDCATNIDNDTFADCLDTCIDEDGDNFGVAGGGGNTCLGADCDDNGAPGCTTNCLTDVDNDSTPDCRDGCLDGDNDGYGFPGGGGNTCLGGDCKDNDPACTTLCSACPPGFLSLSADSPVALCGVSLLVIDLDGYTAAAPDLTCAAPPVVLPAADLGDANGVADFDTSTEGWSLTNATRPTWRDVFPASCPAGGSGSFVRFDNNVTGTLTRSFNLTGLRNITLSFRAGYDDGGDAPDAGEHISVLYCCGATCTPTTELLSAPNFTEGGPNGCQDVPPTAFPITADNCANLVVRFTYSNSGAGTEYAAVDDVQLTATPIIAPIVETTAGLYRSTVSACLPITMNVTCGWDDGVAPVLSDSAQVSFQ